MAILPFAPLDPWKLAANQGIRVWTPTEVAGLSAEHLQVLLRKDDQPSCWSAVTVVVESKILVILNSTHPRGRQANDLTHELAHRILKHKPQEMDVTADGIMMLKSYDKVQEDEADWLSSCLLLPRDALVSIKNRRLNADHAAVEYGVSKKMLNYRLAMSGVKKQFGT